MTVVNIQIEHALMVVTTSLFIYAEASRKSQNPIFCSFIQKI